MKQPKYYKKLCILNFVTAFVFAVAAALFFYKRGDFMIMVGDVLCSVCWIVSGFRNLGIYKKEKARREAKEIAESAENRGDATGN